VQTKRIGEPSAWQARLPPRLLLQRNRLGYGGYELGEARVAAQRIVPDLGIPAKSLQFHIRSPTKDKRKQGTKIRLLAMRLSVKAKLEKVL